MIDAFLLKIMCPSVSVAVILDVSISLSELNVTPLAAVITDLSFASPSSLIIPSESAVIETAPFVDVILELDTVPLSLEKETFCFAPSVASLNSALDSMVILPLSDINVEFLIVAVLSVPLKVIEPDASSLPFAWISDLSFISALPLNVIA